MAFIEFLNVILDSWVMIIVWSIPFMLALAYAWRKRDLRLLMLALFCVPFLVYFTWATTGLWSEHIIALAFNRSAQVCSVAILLLVIIGLIRYECN